MNTSNIYWNIKYSSLHIIVNIVFQLKLWNNGEIICFIIISIINSFAPSNALSIVKGYVRRIDTNVMTILQFVVFGVMFWFKGKTC